MTSSPVHDLRSLLRSWRVVFRQKHAHIRRKLGKAGSDWKTALHGDELAFWERALTDPQHYWIPSEFNERTDPTLELQTFVKELTKAPIGGRIRILDVGAGPLTRLGKKWDGREIEIVAVDPLAEKYDAILERCSLVPPVRTVFGLAEELISQFPESSFDFAYASNSLDHSRDPIKAINQMVAIVKPGAYVYLWHFANAGIVENYHGLHQWNFDIQHDEFLVSDGRTTLSLGKEVADVDSVTCEVQRAFNSRVVVAKLRRRPPAGSAQ